MTHPGFPLWLGCRIHLYMNLERFIGLVHLEPLPIQMKLCGNDTSVKDIVIYVLRLIHTYVMLEIDEANLHGR